MVVYFNSSKYSNHYGYLRRISGGHGALVDHKISLLYSWKCALTAVTIACSPSKPSKDVSLLLEQFHLSLKVVPFPCWRRRTRNPFAMSQVKKYTIIYCCWLRSMRFNAWGSFNLVQNSLKSSVMGRNPCLLAHPRITHVWKPFPCGSWHHVKECVDRKWVSIIMWNK